MLQNSKKKICIIVDCLSGGGAEKQAANFSKSLHKYGFLVAIISLKDQVTYEYEGELYNLGQRESSIKIIKQVQKFLAFKKAYKKCNADMYIDFRSRSRFLMEYALHKFIFEANKMIMMVHSYQIEWHIPKGNIFKKIYNNTHAVVSVSEAIEEKLNRLYAFKNQLYIPNYITTEKREEITTLKMQDDYIIAVGRLQNDIKQFDRLIETYHASKLADKNIKLYVCGDGSDKKSLEKLISTLQLEQHVKLLGFVENVSDYIRYAKFLVLSSRVEGFPMVLIEALQQKTPVISFDCKSGPSEIIQHKINGLLVEDQNFAKLKEAMILLIENLDLYAICEQNALSSIKKFTEIPTIQKWIELITT
ncbi:glycosyltransferase family 4 protein [Kordia sp.]|uniref:glycosyltransferase family 4 protein n=1 Tax=Kordia sp. TaxID=1965332 RepID=UPI0025C12F59|nr:glycosyltransferase family 4 protein [Kordia sp.]MCH2195926.1 glycosyltransferase family 4 protein [Kordia sp.]